MSNITEHIQKSSLGEEVVLVHLDLTKYGQGHLYWVLGDEDALAEAVTFGGQVYTPFPFTLDGFEQSTEGVLPRPTFAVTNVSGILTSLVIGNKNLIGCTLTRIRTFSKFLDDGETPDSNAHFPVDVYELNRKVRGNEAVFIWELVAATDAAGSFMPGRIAQKDGCDLIYRVWNGSTFVYTDATCPYNGSAYFDEFDAPTGSAAVDQCSQRLSGCRARFGANAELPFGGFPGMSKYRVG